MANYQAARALWARESAAQRRRQEVRGEKGETKQVTTATAFSENEDVLMLSKPSLPGAVSQMSNV
jgi:hypothetical protein